MDYRNQWIDVDQEERLDMWRVHMNESVATRAWGVIITYLKNNLLHVEVDQKSAEMDSAFQQEVMPRMEQFKIDAAHHIMVEGIVVCVILKTRAGFFIPYVLPYDSYSLSVRYSMLTERIEYKVERTGDWRPSPEDIYVRDPNLQGLVQTRTDLGRYFPVIGDNDPSVVIYDDFDFRPEASTGALQSMVSRYYPTWKDLEHVERLQMEHLDNQVHPRYYLECAPDSDASRVADMWEPDRYGDVTSENAQDRAENRRSEQESRRYAKRIRQVKAINSQSTGLFGPSSSTESAWDTTVRGLEREGIKPLPEGTKISTMQRPAPDFDMEMRIARAQEAVFEAYGVPMALFKNDMRMASDKSLYLDRLKDAVDSFAISLTGKLLTSIYNDLYLELNSPTLALSIYNEILRPEMQKKLLEYIESPELDRADESGEQGGSGSTFLTNGRRNRGLEAPKAGAKRYFSDREKGMPGSAVGSKKRRLEEVTEYPSTVAQLRAFAQETIEADMTKFLERMPGETEWAKGKAAKFARKVAEIKYTLRMDEYANERSTTELATDFFMGALTSEEFLTKVRFNNGLKQEKLADDVMTTRSKALDKARDKNFDTFMENLFASSMRDVEGARSGGIAKPSSEASGSSAEKTKKTKKAGGDDGSDAKKTKASGGDDKKTKTKTRAEKKESAAKEPEKKSTSASSASSASSSSSAKSEK